MSAQHTPGRLESFILDIPLADIPAYVEQCIKASGGANFYFLSAVDPDLGPVDVAHIGNGPRGGANARRLVACWNACEGISTLDLEVDNVTFTAMLRERDELRAQRDELLEVLEVLERLTHYAECQVAAFSSGRPSLDMTLFPRLCADARAAIAKVKGGAA